MLKIFMDCLVPYSITHYDGSFGIIQIWLDTQDGIKFNYILKFMAQIVIYQPNNKIEFSLHWKF